MKSLRDVVESHITESLYQVIPGTLTTLCSVHMQGGFVQVGQAHCRSAENFDEQLGRELAYKDAIDKLEEMEAYLQSEVTSRRLISADACAAEPKDKQPEDAAKVVAESVRAMLAGMGIDANVIVAHKQ